GRWFLFGSRAMVVVSKDRISVRTERKRPNSLPAARAPRKGPDHAPAAISGSDARSVTAADDLGDRKLQRSRSPVTRARSSSSVYTSGTTHSVNTVLIAIPPATHVASAR